MKIHIAEQVDTVIWDFDGTLLKSFAIFQGVLGTVLQNRGMEVPPEQVFATHFHGPLEHSIRGVVGAHISDHDINGILREFVEIDNDYIERVDDHLHPDAVDLAMRIDAAGGRTQMVVTDREHGIDRRLGSPRNLIQNSCLRDVIRTVICRDDHGYSKPDERVVAAHRHAMKEVLVIGDQVVDAELADRLDGTAVLVRRDSLPMARADELGQLSSRLHIVASLGRVGVQPHAPVIPRHRAPLAAYRPQIDPTTC